jgi:hypothetical protein
VRARWLADALICRRHRAHVRSDASLSSEESSCWRSASLLSCQTYGQPCLGVHRCLVCCPCHSASRRSHREPFFAFEESRVWPTRSRSCRPCLAREGEQSRYRAVASGTRHTPRTTGGRAQRTLDGHADRWGPTSSRAFLGASRGEYDFGGLATHPVKAISRTSQRRCAARASSMRCCTVFRS